MAVKRVSREVFGLDGRVTVVNRRLALPRGRVHRNAPEETCLEGRQGKKTAAHSSRPARVCLWRSIRDFPPEADVSISFASYDARSQNRTPAPKVLRIIGRSLSTNWYYRLLITRGEIKQFKCLRTLRCCSLISWESLVDSPPPILDSRSHARLLGTFAEPLDPPPRSFFYISLNSRCRIH